MKQANMLTIAVILAMIGAMACELASTPTTQFTSPTPSLSTSQFKQLKSAALVVNYDELFRNNEDHIGEIVFYRGQVIQVVEGERDQYQLRTNVTQGEYSWDDAVFLSYSGPRLLEDDIIEFIGRVNGLITYDSIFGQNITIPDIAVVQLQIIAKASDPTPTPAPIPTPTPTPTVPVTPTQTAVPTPTPEPINLAGVGQQASSKFSLDKGLVIFRLKNDGQGYFGIWLLDERGDKVELLVNESGPFDGSKAVGITEAGTYILDVSADGSWSADLARPTTLANLELPITIAGQGQQGTQLFKLASGLTIFKLKNDGQGYFGIWLLDERGDKVELLVNETGPFDGSKAVGIREAGTYILDVSADGNWTVKIE